MYVLGYSGLDGAYEFRLRELEGLSAQEACIFQGMDSAAALVCDGQVVAAIAEERLTGQKHTHVFPRRAIDFCLSQAGIDIDEIAFVAHGFDFGAYRSLYQRSPLNQKRYDAVYSPECQKALLRAHYSSFPVDRVFGSVAHHLAHAASALYQSGFEDALVVVIDGMGEIHSISVYSGSVAHGLKVLRQFGLLSSLGMFYSLATIHLGFVPNADEYKVMGLASYGDPGRFASALKSAIELGPDGAISLPILGLNATPESRETYRGSLAWFGSQCLPVRKPDGPLDDVHRDFAAAVQQTLTEAVVHLLSHWRQVTGHRRLCLAGGVALNCVTNAEVLGRRLFEQIYVQPAAGDDGTSLGAALYRFHEQSPTCRLRPAELPFYGYDIRDSEILDAAAGYSARIAISRFDTEELIRQAAARLAAGEVIAWAQGRMEFGPRALGNRSILADPRDGRMVDCLNRIVKKREPFRPFAPAVKREKTHQYFDVPEGSSFPSMIFTASVLGDAAKSIPAVVHIDGSSRLQTVDREEHPLFWRLLDAFEHATGVSVLLNTSFNVRGQPIVCTPNDAIETLLSTDITALFMGQYLITKVP